MASLEQFYLRLHCRFCRNKRQSAGWLDSWVKNGWKKADRKPVLNVDLWEKLISLLAVHDVEFSWVKGHDGNKYNEICDELAVSEVEKNKKRSF